MELKDGSVMLKMSATKLNNAMRSHSFPLGIYTMKAISSNEIQGHMTSAQSDANTRIDAIAGSKPRALGTSELEIAASNRFRLPY